ncbi:dephospho-CoA kinase [Ornithinibacillus contaminans]|uniref:dephospho-CoA kinase n=1 Tax=Ornithinibacillus contaminans TaxID=694055 RepID=UPI00064DDF8E|nr:dephospho-CoA kinase [Ornithinibacillus contaminans]
MGVVIGLTGSIASGKSTVSGMFKKLNIPVIDADQIARDVVVPGEAAYHQIVAEFGEDILLADKTIDRKKLGSIIFADKEKREALNAIVHPVVRSQMLYEKEQYLAANKTCIVMDIPLLYESNLTHLVDKVLVVYVDESVQLERLMNRDGSTIEAAMERIDSQIPVKEKVKQADAVINNNGTIQDSYQQLKDILKQWNISYV